MLTDDSRTLAIVLLGVLALPGLEHAVPSQLPEVIVSPSSVGQVEFLHETHASDLGIECATCHHETDATALDMPHQDYFEDFWIDCETCHRPAAAPASPQPCSACHHASPTTIADESLSAKVVVHRSCWGCHEGGKGQEASRSCRFCHRGPKTEPQHQPTER